MPVVWDRDRDPCEGGGSKKGGHLFSPPPSALCVCCVGGVQVLAGSFAQGRMCGLLWGDLQSIPCVVVVPLLEVRSGLGDSAAVGGVLCFYAGSVDGKVRWEAGSSGTVAVCPEHAVPLEYGDWKGWLAFFLGGGNGRIAAKGRLG